MNADFSIKGKKLETERLILRAFESTDLDDFYEYASVDGVGQMAGWAPHKNKAESEEILRGFIDGDRDFALCLKENGKVIGSVGVKRYAREEALTEFSTYRGSELGATLGKAYWGRGLMPEALQAVIDYLFEDLDYDFLLGGYYDFNERSRRMQAKLGFRPYRKLIMETHMGTREPAVMNLLLNPSKEIRLVFSHPETLIYSE